MIRVERFYRYRPCFVYRPSSVVLHVKDGDGRGREREREEEEILLITIKVILIIKYEFR